MFQSPTPSGDRVGREIRQCRDVICSASRRKAMVDGVCRNMPIPNARPIGVERDQVRRERCTTTLASRPQDDHASTISASGSNRNDPHSVHALEGDRPE